MAQGASILKTQCLRHYRTCSASSASSVWSLKPHQSSLLPSHSLPEDPRSPHNTHSMYISPSMSHHHHHHLQHWRNSTATAMHVSCLIQHNTTATTAPEFSSTALMLNHFGSRAHRRQRGETQRVSSAAEDSALGSEHTEETLRGTHKGTPHPSTHLHTSRISTSNSNSKSNSSSNSSSSTSISPSSGTLTEAVEEECGSLGSVIIHPTALVHPDAVLMEGVEVGPFCTVGPLVRLGRGCKLHPNSHVQGDTVLGDFCTLYTGAIVGSDLPGWTRLGTHNKIGHYTLVGIRCQDLKYKEGTECFVEVGSHNDIREHAQVHRSSKPDDVTVIGDHNLIMGACHVAHDCKLGNRNILANNTLLAGHVILKDFVHAGGAVAVHQFCHVDSFSFLAGGSMVTRDVPMYTMVSGDRAELRGLNLEGLRRCGFTTHEVRDIRRAYQKLFMSTEELSGFEGRLTELEESELGQKARVKALLDSIRGSFQEKRRGICKFRHWSSLDGV